MGLTIGDMTTGIDFDGIKDYLETLQTNLIDNVSTELTETKNNIIAAVQAAWVGEAEAKFEKEFETSIEAMQAQLTKEYDAIFKRFTELKNNYLNQDANMMGGE